MSTSNPKMTGKRIAVLRESRKNNPHRTSRFDIVPLRQVKNVKDAPGSSERIIAFKDVTNTPTRPPGSESYLVAPPSIKLTTKPLNITKSKHSIPTAADNTKMKFPSTRSSRPSQLSFDFLNGPPSFTKPGAKHRRRESSVVVSNTPNSVVVRSAKSIPTTPNASFVPSFIPAITPKHAPATSTPNTRPSSRIGSITSRIPTKSLPRHGVTHSFDLATLSAALPVRRKDIRSVFPPDTVTKYAKLEAVAQNDITPMSTLRIRNTTQSLRTPSKRHAIYTQSLCIGRTDISTSSKDNVEDNFSYLRSLPVASPLSLHRVYPDFTTTYQGMSEVTSTRNISTTLPRIPSDSLKSIVQGYHDDQPITSHQAAMAVGLPSLATSLSEPTLHDIDGHSLAMDACLHPSSEIVGSSSSLKYAQSIGGVGGEGNVSETTPSTTSQSPSLTSVSGSLPSASIYSQDSWPWISGATSSSSGTSGTSCSEASSGAGTEILYTTVPGKINTTMKPSPVSGYHPIVWDLLQKLEVAQKAWSAETVEVVA